MNIQRRLKSILIEHLSRYKPAEDIEVIDAKRLDLATLPTIAVEVTDEKAHSQALWSVIVCQVSVLYRVHAGDIEQPELDYNMDVIEQALQDPNELVVLGDENSLVIFNWLYQGSVQEWNDSMVDTVFTAECIVTRKPINQN
jgi:hypothetical protein